MAFTWNFHFTLIKKYPGIFILKYFTQNYLETIENIYLQDFFKQRIESVLLHLGLSLSCLAFVRQQVDFYVSGIKYKSDRGKQTSPGSNGIGA